MTEHDLRDLLETLVDSDQYEDLPLADTAIELYDSATPEQKQRMFVNLLAYHERVRTSILASAASTLRERAESRRDLITNFARFIQGTDVISDEMAFGMLVGQYIASAK